MKGLYIITSLTKVFENKHAEAMVLPVALIGHDMI